MSHTVTIEPRSGSHMERHGAESGTPGNVYQRNVTVYYLACDKCEYREKAHAFLSARVLARRHEERPHR